MPHTESKNEQDVIMSIIEMYKARPFLWNKSHKDYYNKNIRNEGFKVILDAFRTLDKNIDLKAAKKKIENMRTNYSRELKKVLASKQEGDGEDDVYIPNLWYFNALSFLGNIPLGSRSRESLGQHQPSVDLPEENEDLSSDDENITTTTLNTSQKRKIDETLLEKQGKLLETVEKLVKKLPDKDQHLEVYGRAIGHQLRDINEDQLVICQKLISDTIFYAKFNKLNECSQIVTPSDEPY